MNREKLERIIEKIKSVRIAVIGDFCLDAYWFIDQSKSEISVETGKPVFSVKQQRYSLGGAGNVAGNLTAMGVRDVRAFGVIGADHFGNEMIRVMKEAGIKTGNLLIQEENWSTHVYVKPYIGDVEQSRIDFGNFNRLATGTADMLIERVAGEIMATDLIIINEQVISGIHTPYLRDKLVSLINNFPEKIFIADSRNYSDFYDGAYRKMNDTEAAVLCGINKDPADVVLYSEVKEAALKLYKKYGKPL
ncbi:MAG: hypothetical protein GX820_08210, partial [Bacteroidales bacterium]|nr:hypothetical protein [Bacteroidales bacterium]